MVLTLDIGLQGYVEQVLAASVPAIDVEEETGGAACVVLDVDTAEVLTCASYPTYDITPLQRRLQPVRPPTQPSPCSTGPSRACTPPGSTFKMVTAVAGLETGIIEPDTEIEDLGRYTYWSSPQPMCWIYWQRGPPTAGSTCPRPSRCPATTSSMRWAGRWASTCWWTTPPASAWASTPASSCTRRRGHGQPGVHRVPGGHLVRGQRAVGGHRPGEQPVHPPVQLANYIATLVNGGTRNAVHLLKEVKSGDFSQVEYTYEPQVLGTIEIETENLQAVKAGMLALTTQGSVSQHFRDLPFQAGGKTGSAQVDDQTDANAIFVCFAPYDDPEVALALVVERGGSGSSWAPWPPTSCPITFPFQETRDEAPQENTLVR